jgi:hypothetical protein
LQLIETVYTFQFHLFISETMFFFPCNFHSQWQCVPFPLLRRTGGYILNKVLDRLNTHEQGLEMQWNKLTTLHLTYLMLCMIIHFLDVT